MISSFLSPRFLPEGLARLQLGSSFQDRPTRGSDPQPTHPTASTAQLPLADTPPPTPVVTDPPEWVPDEACGFCTACKAPFTVIRRKHHCRSCGKVGRPEARGLWLGIPGDLSDCVRAWQSGLRPRGLARTQVLMRHT